MNTIELLSPCKNMEVLKAVIKAGCDAVYLGGKKFGARAFADNFSDEEIIEAIEYAHLYRKKVYVTVNVIIFERQFEDAIAFCDMLAIHSVDGIIVQDIGLFNIIRLLYKNVEIHCSTQMSINSLLGVSFFEDLGANRIVLARENTIQDIKYIRQHTNIPLEVFVHGALCVSYSGQCYISSLIGDRSGNQGTCSQICRKKYMLYNKTKDDMLKSKHGDYLLSLKDLNTISKLDELLKVNNISLKIEGRMKSMEYAYEVTNTYRKKIDANDDNTDSFSNDINRIKSIFHREFTHGFLFHDDNVVNQYRPNNIGLLIGEVIDYRNKLAYIKLKEDMYQGDGIRIIEKQDYGQMINKLYVKGLLKNMAYKNTVCAIPVKRPVHKNSLVYRTSNSQLLKEIQHSINDVKIYHTVDIFFDGTTYNTLNAIFIVDDIKYHLQSDFLIEVSTSQEFDENRFIKQMNKTKDTAISFCIKQINISSGSYISIKNMNEFRRIIIRNINNILLQKEKIHYDRHEITNNLIDYEKFNSISVSVNTIEQLSACLHNNINTIYLSNLSILEEAKSYKLDIIPVQSKMNASEQLKDNDILISNYDGFYKYADRNIRTNFNFNVVNSESIRFMHLMNVKSVCLSPEVKIQDIKHIYDRYYHKYHKKPNLEYIVYGKIEAMHMKYCVISSTYGISKKQCNLCKQNDFYLVDQLGKQYPITTNDNCDVTINHFKPIDYVKEIKNIKNYINMFRINFVDETYTECVEILHKIKDVVE